MASCALALPSTRITGTHFICLTLSNSHHHSLINLTPLEDLSICVLHVVLHGSNGREEHKRCQGWCFTLPLHIILTTLDKSLHQLVHVCVNVWVRGEVLTITTTVEALNATNPVSRIFLQTL